VTHAAGADEEPSHAASAGMADTAVVSEAKAEVPVEGNVGDGAGAEEGKEGGGNEDEAGAAEGEPEVHGDEERKGGGKSRGKRNKKRKRKGKKNVVSI